MAFGVDKKGNITVIGRRGRPLGSGKQDAAIKAMRDVGEVSNDLPEEIVLSEDAPLALLIVASFTNFLNRNTIDENVLSEFKKRKIDAELVAKDREKYTMQIIRVRKEVYTQYGKDIMDMGNYIIEGTTSGLGSVMATMTGDSDKRGKRRE